MSLTRAQRWLYWREVKAAERIAFPSGRPPSDWRHEVHIRALGHDKSSTAFSNADLDKVLAELRAISQPGNLVVQLDAISQPVFRLRNGIRRLARKIAGENAENYVQAVIDQMDSRRGDAVRDDDEEETDFWQRERTRSDRPQRHLEQLGPEDLLDVRIALTQQDRREQRRLAESGNDQAMRPPSQHLKSLPE